MGGARGRARPVPERPVLGAAPRRVGDVVVPDTGGRLEGVDAFTWTPREFVDEGLLAFCFTDANDASNQIPFIRERVQHQLRRFAVDVDGEPGRRGAARPVARRPTAARGGAGSPATPGERM